jgi:hypothetical protein
MLIDLTAQGLTGKEVEGWMDDILAGNEGK